MQVSVETIQGLQRRMTVQVPSERVDKEVESRLRSLTGRVRLDGFRPGKVPFKVVQKRYGGEIRSEVLSEVVQATYTEALSRENLRPAGAPEIDPRQIAAGRDVEYVATFEVLPDVELQGVDGVEVERPMVDIVDTDIDKILEGLRKQNATYSEVERAADKEYKVVIDFTGEIDGQPFGGNEGQDVAVIIGSGQMPSEFEESLAGMKVGDSKDIEYIFPEHFPDKDVAGKKAVFHVAMKSVMAPEIPEVNDAFAEQLGIKEGGVESVRSKIRESLERDCDQAIKMRLKRQVMDSLATANQFELPRVLIDGEIEHLRRQVVAQMQQYGQSIADGEPPASYFEQNARRRVTLGLVVNEIIRKNNIRLDQARLRQMLEEIASGYDQPQQVMQYYLQNRKLLEGVEVAALEDQVVDWVLERAAFKAVPMSFQELTTGIPAEVV